VKDGVSTTLDDLIKAALTGQPYNQRRLGAEAQRYARRLSNAKAPDLPEDLHEEICQQAFVELFRIGQEGLARRSGKALFRRAVLAAVRVVRASYAPPGQRTRASKAQPSPLVAAEDIGRIADRAALARSHVVDETGDFIAFDRFADPRAQDDLQQIEDALDVVTLLKGASADIALALRLIHQDDEPVAMVAAVVAMDRFKLNRRLKAFCGAIRAAA